VTAVRAAAGAVIAALLLAGCAGDGDTEDVAAPTSTAEPRTSTTRATPTTTSLPSTVGDALALAQREHPELSFLSLDDASQIAATACVSRSEGLTMEQVTDRLGIAAVEQDLSDDGIRGLGLFLGHAMRALCPNFAP
jgi:PBP1b-binding outer membrane lipoprotein LpoB